MEFLDSLGHMLASTLRISTPLILAALGGMMSERAGVVNIALEGIMLGGAFGGTVLALSTHSPYIGAAAAIGVGIILAVFYAIFVIELRANQIVAGMAVNLFVAGATPLLCKILYESSTSTPSLAMEYRFQYGPMWIAWILVGLSWWWLKYTPSGLWVRFAGEHPAALDSAGVGVRKIRWFAVLMSGALAGFAGASLSIFLASSFTRNMTSGRGFMAVAALIFGKWKPIPTAIACLLFGFTDALQSRLQGVVLWGTEPVPVQFIQIIPYLVTMFVLAGMVGQARAPKALGLPFEKP